MNTGISSFLFRPYNKIALKEGLARAARPVADRMALPISLPSDSERQAVKAAFARIRRLESAWGKVGWVVVLLAGVSWCIASTDKALWVRLFFPSLVAGALMSTLMEMAGVAFAKSRQDYKTAVLAAAKLLVLERSKTEHWKTIEWRELEHRVAALFTRKGYDARVQSGTGDKGVDVVAKSGTEKIVIQCKQYAKPAQRNLVSELLGVMVAEGADKAILICTGGFTKAAEEYAHKNGVILWDLDDLVREWQGLNG